MKLVSKRAHELLKQMRQAELDEEFEDAQIVCDGRECWLGLEKTSRQIVNELLRLCLVSDMSDGGGTERYGLNEDGRKWLDDPDYVPRILRINRE